MKNRRLIEFARNLRRDSTEAEYLLWSRLRNRRLSGFKFRRQHVVASYILDFYCDAARLAIEVDGAGHNMETQAMYDDYRTSDLQSRRIRVLRFWNHEVLQKTDAVLAEIHRELSSRPDAKARS
jgi:very-short-patch-repair endonuclease